MKQYIVDNKWLRLRNTKGMPCIEPVKFTNYRQALRVFLNNVPMAVHKRHFKVGRIVPKYTAQIDVIYIHERNKRKIKKCLMYWKSGNIVKIKDY